MKRDAPTPLTHAGSEDRELLELLEAGRSDLPDRDTLGALEARIVPILVGPPSSFPPPAGTPGGGAGAGAGLGGSASSGAAAGAAGGTAGTAGLAGGKLAVAVVLAAAVGAGTWSLTRAPSERADDPAQTAPSRNAPAAPAPRAAPTSRAADVVPVTAPDVPAPAPITAPSHDVAEPLARPARTRPSARHAPAHTVEASAPPHETEALLLSRAQAALESRPIDSLSLTREHERRFPDGMLAPEREVIAIDALLRLGRRERALARAERFLERSPDSAHARRVRVLISSEAP